MKSWIACFLLGGSRAGQGPPRRLRLREQRDLKEARERYQNLSSELEDEGILHDENFTESVLFTPDKIVVAASTGGLPEKIADFSTPSDFVTVAIDGTEIPVVMGTSSGTSHAAPQVRRPPTFSCLWHARACRRKISKPHEPP